MGQKPGLTFVPELRGCFYVPIILRRLKFVTYPIPQRAPLPDKALVTDVNNRIVPQRNLPRRHQEIAFGPSEGVDHTRDCLAITLGERDKIAEAAGSTDRVFDRRAADKCPKHNLDDWSIGLGKAHEYLSGVRIERAGQPADSIIVGHSKLDW